MTVVLAMARTDLEVISNALDEAAETAFFGDVVFVADAKRPLFLLHGVHEVPHESYVERSRQRMVIASTGFVPAISRALQAGRVPCFIHTHPGGSPTHSSLDDLVDRSLAEFSRQRSLSATSYLSIVVSGTRHVPQVRARIVGDDDTFVAVDLVRVVGDGLVLYDAATETPGTTWSFFDRQVRAFGADGQRLLAGLKIGVVGVGGTGSAVSEQLARLGVGELVIADDDVVTKSNVSRIYGSTIADVGAFKVDVVRRHLERIGLATRVQEVAGRVTKPEVAREFRTCDVVFGCTDDQWGRAVLARLAYWYLVPLLDMGVVIGTDAGRVQEVIGRVTVVSPGTACLLCRGRIQPEVVAAEALTPAERSRRQAEGYVPELGDRDPAVVTYTSLIASVATSEFLNLLLRLGDISTPASELLVRIDGHSIRGNVIAPRPGHFCDAATGTWGSGDVEPFLGQLWT